MVSTHHIYQHFGVHALEPEDSAGIEAERVWLVTVPVVKLGVTIALAAAP